jgi:hypothetical protein
MLTIMTMVLSFFSKRLRKKKEKPRFSRGFSGIFELPIILGTGSDSAPPPQSETNSG